MIQAAVDAQWVEMGWGVNFPCADLTACCEMMCRACPNFALASKRERAVRSRHAEQNNLLTELIILTRVLGNDEPLIIVDH